jgi:hypothetical protein
MSQVTERAVTRGYSVQPMTIEEKAAIIAYFWRTRDFGTSRDVVGVDNPYTGDPIPFESTVNVSINKPTLNGDYGSIECSTYKEKLIADVTRQTIDRDDFRFIGGSAPPFSVCTIEQWPALVTATPAAAAHVRTACLATIDDLKKWAAEMPYDVVVKKLESTNAAQAVNQTYASGKVQNSVCEVHKDRIYFKYNLEQPKLYKTHAPKLVVMFAELDANVVIQGILHQRVCSTTGGLCDSYDAATRLVQAVHNDGRSQGTVSLLVAFCWYCSVLFCNIQTGETWRVILERPGDCVVFPDYLSVSICVLMYVFSMYVCMYVCMCGYFYTRMDV